jgi:hypothetical protein
VCMRGTHCSTLIRRVDLALCSFYPLLAENMPFVAEDLLPLKGLFVFVVYS